MIPDIWDAVSREQIEERPNQVVNNKAQYCSVVRTGFGKTKLIIGGEVDAGTQNQEPSFLERLLKLFSPSVGLQTSPQGRPDQLGRAEDDIRAVHRPREDQVRAEASEVLGPILPPGGAEGCHRIP